MNPWLSEQLGDAHRRELRRVAGVSVVRSKGRSGPFPSPRGHFRGGLSPRRAVGLLLIRVGARLVRIEPPSHPLRPLA